MRLALAMTLAAIWGTLGVVRGIVNYLRPMYLIEPLTAAGGACIAIFVFFRVKDKRAILLTTLVAVALFAVAWLVMKSPEERIHLIEYGTVGVLSALVFESYALAFALTALFGWIDEMIQAFTPDRMYDVRDVALNVIAGTLGLCLLATYRVLKRKT